MQLKSVVWTLWGERCVAVGGVGVWDHVWDGGPGSQRRARIEIDHPRHRISLFTEFFRHDNLIVSMDCRRTQPPYVATRRDSTVRTMDMVHCWCWLLPVRLTTLTLHADTNNASASHWSIIQRPATANRSIAKWLCLRSPYAAGSKYGAY